MYDKQLREEELQTSVELAREIAPSEDELAARRNAKMIIQRLERTPSEQFARMERDEGNVIQDLWRYSGGPSAQIFWAWAYDADWDPASVNVTVCDGEEYQGRIRVSIYCLDAWFCAGR
ncbi:uncharacterized protein LY79DRAFT_579043 [Colletotrichum navitas]|uniref:Uncharacterized protein n=1 Tax=Colletotrichum navitas TaxID=681940 RepID=A0AAD8V5K9_9PEZI|nr:uncharacterized protein LY79DRAFT_579043 [Colletotrichum navitas]KAK1593824.1 hypothetical protein LY79DRAFT_579043 [Colletotrichum navitas]